MPGVFPASRLEAFPVLVPAGTTIAAPVEVDTSWLPGELVALEVVIPSGVNGLAGVRIALAHHPVIPATAGEWIVGNGEVVPLDTVGYPNSGAWSVYGYNLDQFPHTFRVRYHVADFPYVNPDTAVAPNGLPLIP